MGPDDIDGPDCAVCGEHEVPLQRYRADWWCRECIEAEEAHEHGQAFWEGDQ